MKWYLMGLDKIQWKLDLIKSCLIKRNFWQEMGKLKVEYFNHWEKKNVFRPNDMEDYEREKKC